MKDSGYMGSQSAGLTADSKFKAREELRQLSHQLDESRALLTQTSSKGLAEAQRKANRLFDVAQHEAVGQSLDATVLSKVSNLGAEQAGNLDKQGETFIRKLKASFATTASGNTINWPKLAELVDSAGIFQHVPALTFCLCNIEMDESAPEEQSQQPSQRRQRVVRQASEPQSVADTMQLTQLQEEADDKAQLSRVEILYSCLMERAGPNGLINMFKLLLHPNSFSQTVENFFDLAFLAKEGRVSIEADGECTYVSTARPPEASIHHNIVKNQNILQLDYSTYRKLVERWCDGPSLIPCREDGAQQPQKKKRRGL